MFGSRIEHFLAWCGFNKMNYSNWILFNEKKAHLSCCCNGKLKIYTLQDRYFCTVYMYIYIYIYVYVYVYIYVYVYVYYVLSRRYICIIMFLYSP